MLSKIKVKLVPLYFYAYYKFITLLCIYLSIIFQSSIIYIVGLFIFLTIGQKVLFDKFSQSIALKDSCIEKINLASKSRKICSLTPILYEQSPDGQHSERLRFHHPAGVTGSFIINSGRIILGASVFMIT